MKAARVYLVGAGPGDPGLITLSGLACLKKADVIVYDRLLDDRLLDLAPPTAERIYVGKAAGKHTKTQDEINRLLAAKASEGKTVVRLKGGDPFVLGRGGEETEFLAENSVPFSVVPGVTSAIAAPAYAGIPVTRRGVASSLAIITGHEDPSQEVASVDWSNLASGVDTLLFLMGLKNLPRIVSGLLELGWAATTPVAVIQDGTRPEQKTVVGNLKDIVTLVKKEGLAPPCVIVVGEVVNFRDRLRWFDNRPLSGKRVLVTRPRHQAGDLCRLLAERGAVPVALPAIEIKPIGNRTVLDKAISKLRLYDWIIFTSVNGVDAFWRRLADLGLDSRALCGRQIGAIGPATAEALVSRGVTPDYVPEKYTSTGILAGLGQRDIADKRFLLPRADKADKELPQGIRRLGAEVQEVTAYRTLPADESIAEARRRLVAREIDVVTFTSPSTVANLVTVLRGEPRLLSQVKIACIGPKTAEAATGAGLRVDIIASEPTIPSLVTAIEDYYREEP